MSRTQHRVDTRELPFEPLAAAAAPVRRIPPLASPGRVRRRRVNPGYWLYRIRIGWRRRRLNGDAALLVLSFLLFLATIAGAVALVVTAH